jgi:drug/metabolite transporter (DMT)-like permease
VTARQFGILCILALTWGCSFLFIKVIVEAGVEPVGMSGVRTLLGALSLLPFAWFARRGFRQSRATWGAMIGLGVLNFAIPWTLFGVAGNHVPSGVSAVANASAPLWSAILATLFLKADVLGPQRVAGLAVGFLGVVILMGGDLAGLSGSQAGSISLILIATLCYATAAVSIRKWLSAVPPVPLAFVQVGTAASLLMPAAFLTGAFDGAEISLKVSSSAVALGTLGSGVAVVAYMYLIQNVGPVRASIVTYMAPPIGVILGWLVLDESIGWNLLAALACILVGVALVQGVPLRSLVARLPGRPPAVAAAD